MIIVKTYIGYNVCFDGCAIPAATEKQAQIIADSFKALFSGDSSRLQVDEISYRYSKDESKTLSIFAHYLLDSTGKIIATEYQLELNEIILKTSLNLSEITAFYDQIDLNSTKC